jgi:CRISPR-associated endoribonuclease Cas6
MRFRIVFTLKNKGAMLPFHHQDLLHKFLVELVGTETLLKSNYHFSGIKGQTQITKNGLTYYSNRVTWVIAAFEKEFVTEVLEKIFSLPQLQVGEMLLTPEYVEQETFPVPTEAMQYLCISPMVLLNPESKNFYAKRFFSPSEPMFSDFLYEATLNRIEATRQFSEQDIETFKRFQLIPDQLYLAKIKDSDKKFARIYTIQEQMQKYELRGYTFPFTLYAHPKVQQFVLQCGLGAYTQHGYGMLDLVDHSQTVRTVIYDFNKIEVLV